MLENVVLEDLGAQVEELLGGLASTEELLEQDGQVNLEGLLLVRKEAWQLLFIRSLETLLVELESQINFRVELFCELVLGIKALQDLLDLVL